MRSYILVLCIYAQSYWKYTSGTRKVRVNNPTGIAHIVGVASYSEA